ncbi:hypothetical protein MBLNU13_g07368t2 [Cladosporium sp. NU13]
MATWDSPVNSSTSIIYTPKWAFVEPWVLAISHTTPVILHLTASTTSATIPTAAPISIIFDGSRGGDILHQHIASANCNTEFAFDGSATTSDGISTSPALTAPVVPPSTMPINNTPTPRTPNNESLSSPTITATLPSYSGVHAASSPSKVKSGLSLGQTIGIVIGCFFLAATFAVLAACVFVHGKPLLIIMEHIERPIPYMRFETLLARPSSDDELVAMFTQVNSSIADYAQMWISPNTRSQLLATESDSTQVLNEILGPESPISVKKVSALLQYDQTRAASLRHIIAWSILQNVRSTGAPETTLLPPEISECISSMTGMQADVNGMAPHW